MAKLGLPSINIIFKTTAAASIQRSEKGIVAMLLRGSSSAEYRLTNVTETVDEVDDASAAYIARCWTGYINPPKRILVRVLSEDEEVADGLKWADQKDFDYLVLPPDATAEEAETTAAWIKSERNEGRKFKAVLANNTADSDGVVNFTTGNIHVGDTVYTAAEYCSRIAGLIAGTPMTISCTYAPLAEITAIDSATKDEVEEKIGKGEFVLWFDGEKVKVGRGVNSFITTTQDKGDQFKKIKIVETVDMIRYDLRTTIDDSYIGKYANSYNNRVLLLTAIQGYFESMENDGILERGTSTVDFDLEAIATYLKAQGTDTSDYTEQQLREAATDDQVFITADLTILDAIEAVKVTITI
jgi:hypothetical protein